MHVTILGTGAMACLVGSRLAPFAEVTLVGSWNEAVEAIREHGILVSEETSCKSVSVGAAFAEEPITPAKLVIVLVKSWRTERAAERLDSLVAPGGAVLTLQNGLGNLERLGPSAHLGVTTLGATLLEPGKVRPGGEGPTHIAGPPWIAELFARAGMEASSCPSEEAESLLWGKLVVNCGINALTALLDVPTGSLLKLPGAAELMGQSAMECTAVAHARGTVLPFDDPTARVREVALRTATNLSSMLQDLRRGAQTECDAINGAVVLEGRRLAVRTPVNEVLWTLMMAARQGQMDTNALSE